MLVLTRKRNESIVIFSPDGLPLATIRFVKTEHDRCRVGCIAHHPNVQFERLEIVAEDRVPRMSFGRPKGTAS